jgi:dephospho-CoA kinase
MILCLVGPSCAGKTTSAEYVREDRNVAHLEASEFVKNRYSSSTFSSSLIEFVKKEFDNKGKETFARRVCEEISKIDDDEVIISGFRTKQEVDFVKQQFGNVLVAGIYANSLLRFQRKIKRDNPKSEYQYQDFIQKDFIEYNFGIMKVLDDESDTLIVNEGTFNELYDLIDNTIVKLIDLD